MSDTTSTTTPSAGNPPAPTPVPKSFAQQRLAQDQAAAAKRPPPDGNAIPVPKPAAETSMDAAACIGCGACVAACPNASASLFTGAKITHLGVLPQGQPERDIRVLAMVAVTNVELFGSCTNIGECSAVCPKLIPLEVIARMNQDFIRASWSKRK